MTCHFFWIRYSVFRTHSEKLLAEKEAEDERNTNEAIANIENDRDPDALSNLQNENDQITNSNQTQNTQPNTSDWNLGGAKSFSRPTSTGQTEYGQRIERVNDSGDKEIIMGFPPERGSGSAWALAPGTSKLMERERSDGSKEVGVKWVRINEDGTLEQTIKWEKVVDEEGANAIAAGTTTIAAIGNTGSNDGNTGNETNTGETQTNTNDGGSQDNNIADDNLTSDGRSYTEIIASGEHMEVKRGGHILELPAGNHVIGGVFDDFQSAEEASDRLFHRGLRETIVGYVSARGHYYVVVGTFNSVQRAQEAKGRIKSTYSLKDVWVLKVNQ